METRSVRRKRMPKITGWERDYWSEILPQIERLANERNEAELARLSEQIFAYWREERHLSPSTIRNPLTNLRNEIKKIPVTDQNSVVSEEGVREHLALRYIRLTQQEWVALNAPAREKLDERLRDSIKLNEVDALVARAIGLLSSSNPSDVAVGVAVCCGRRFLEVMKTAVFRSKTDYSLWFSGQVKGRSREDRPFEIPTLAPAPQVLAAVTRLRQLVDAEMDETLLSNKYGQAVRDAADRHFADLVPVRDDTHESLYTHLLRSVYATIATFWFAPEPVKAIAYIAEIQGHRLVLQPESSSGEQPETSEHQQLNYASALHYFDYVVATPDGHIDRRQGIRLGEPGVEIIDAFKPKETGVMREERKEPATRKLKGKRKPNAKYSNIRVDAGTRDHFDAVHERMVPYCREQDGVVRKLLEVYEAAEVVTPSPLSVIPTLWTPDLLDVSEEERLLIQTHLAQQPLTDLRIVFTRWLVHEAQQSQQEEKKGPDFSAMSTPHLTRYRDAEASRERLRRGLYTVMQWNERNEPRRRWRINVRLLQALVGGRKEIIGAVLDEHAAEIELHHQTLHIPKGYNKSVEFVKEDIPALPEAADAYPWNQQAKTLNL
jgi:Telomere resolvase